MSGRPDARPDGGVRRRGFGAGTTIALPVRMRIVALMLGCGACATTVQGPLIEPVEDQVVAVGDELRLELRAGDPAEWSFWSNADTGARATLTARPDGALFRFRPSAQDVGRWVFDFRADGDGGASIESAGIEVRPALDAAPVFRRPVGAGTAVDGDCIELDVVVTDQDSTAVAIREVEPRIAGATLVQDGDLTATWRWCPDDGQRGEERFVLTLAADDGVHPAALLRFQLVLGPCRDDGHEEDDGPATERWTDLDRSPVLFGGNQICAGDDDWYGLELYPGETFTAAARFDAPSPAGDLDLFLRDPGGAAVAAAQAVGSAERLTFTSEDGGAYHLVVHGWQGAANAYDLCASLAGSDCP